MSNLVFALSLVSFWLIANSNVDAHPLPPSTKVLTVEFIVLPSWKNQTGPVIKKRCRTVSQEIETLISLTNKSISKFLFEGSFHRKKKNFKFNTQAYEIVCTDNNITRKLDDEVTWLDQDLHRTMTQLEETKWYSFVVLLTGRKMVNLEGRLLRSSSVKNGLIMSEDNTIIISSYGDDNAFDGGKINPKYASLMEQEIFNILHNQKCSQTYEWTLKDVHNSSNCFQLGRDQLNSILNSTEAARSLANKNRFDDECSETGKETNCCFANKTLKEGAQCSPINNPCCNLNCQYQSLDEVCKQRRGCFSAGTCTANAECWTVFNENSCNSASGSTPTQTTTVIPTLETTVIPTAAPLNDKLDWSLLGVAMAVIFSVIIGVVVYFRKQIYSFFFKQNTRNEYELGNIADDSHDSEEENL